MKKVKLPTEFITLMVYCRNCRCRNEATRAICKQCERPMDNPMKRPYK